MSISTYGSASVQVFVAGDVVQNVVGLGQEMGPEGHLLWFWSGIGEGAEVGWRESFGGPIPVRLGKQLAFVSLVSITQYFTICTCQLTGLAALPGLANGEILLEMLRVYTRRWGKHTGEERLRLMKL